jgi:hypothetical protein
VKQSATFLELVVVRTAAASFLSCGNCFVAQAFEVNDAFFEREMFGDWRASRRENVDSFHFPHCIDRSEVLAQPFPQRLQ